MSGKKSFFQFTITDLEEFLLENGFKKFNAKQLFTWIYQSKKKNPEDWTNISKKLKEFFLENFFLDLPQIVWEGHSKDGTRKFLVKFTDEKTVETVLIPPKREERSVSLAKLVVQLAVLFVIQVQWA